MSRQTGCIEISSFKAHVPYKNIALLLHPIPFSSFRNTLLELTVVYSSIFNNYKM